MEISWGLQDDSQFRHLFRDVPSCLDLLVDVVMGSSCWQELLLGTVRAKISSAPRLSPTQIKLFLHSNGKFRSGLINLVSLAFNLNPPPLTLSFVVYIHS